MAMLAFISISKIRAISIIHGNCKSGMKKMLMAILPVILSINVDLCSKRQNNTDTENVIKNRINRIAFLML